MDRFGQIVAPPHNAATIVPLGVNLQSSCKKTRIVSSRGVIVKLAPHTGYILISTTQWGGNPKRPGCLRQMGVNLEKGVGRLFANLTEGYYILGHSKLLSKKGDFGSKNYSPSVLVGHKKVDDASRNR